MRDVTYAVSEILDLSFHLKNTQYNCMRGYLCQPVLLSPKARLLHTVSQHASQHARSSANI